MGAATCVCSCAGCLGEYSCPSVIDGASLALVTTPCIFDAECVRDHEGVADSAPEVAVEMR